MTAEEALDQNVIDLIAPTLPALLDETDGRTTEPKGLVLDTAGARDRRRSRCRSGSGSSTSLIDPNIIALMLSIGLLGIIVELWNPGLIFPGTVGAISLILGLFGAAGAARQRGPGSC